MATPHAEYLALNLLSEGQTVTYRSLSRALKVHSNLAKQMLYGFHQTQNSKKPGSVHATYLLTGRQHVLPKSNHTDAVQDGDRQDTNMHSSPLPASSAPGPQENEQEDHSWIKLITLAKEEQLDDAKANFDELLSIHVYSLEPGTINDLEVLTECNRKVAADFASEDPLEVWRQYGTIQNTNVKRRTTRRPPPPVAAVPAAKPKSTVKQEAPTTTTKTTKATKESAKPTAASEAATVDTTTEKEQKPASLSRKNSAAKPPTIKRDVSSIFKSFAKAKPKTQKPAAGDSAEPSPAQTPVEDESMGGLSDEEAGDDDTAMFDEGALEAPAGKSKKEREEELRLMMEADDEPMEDAPTESANSAPSTAPVTEKEESQTKPEPEPSETVTISNGRRHGRRRVMKKKTVKDEEGYLVTREEPAWESFSEDEPAPKKAKISAPVPAPAKGKKGTVAKAGQGNIMSFFKKA